MERGGGPVRWPVAIRLSAGGEREKKRDEDDDDDDDEDESFRITWRSTLGWPRGSNTGVLAVFVIGRAAGQSVFEIRTRARTMWPR